MRSKLIVLAVAATLAVATGGVVTAAVTDAPTAPASHESPSDAVPPENHTVDVVDPDDELSPDEVRTATELAWADPDVRDRFADDQPVHFDGQASTGDGDVSVWIGPNESALASVVADLDLETGAVTDVTEPETLEADESVELNGSTTEEVGDGIYAIDVSGNASDDIAENLTVERHDDA